MESRSGRLRGSNKKTEGNLCFFCSPFLQGLKGSSLTLFVEGLVHCPTAIVLQKAPVTSPCFAGRTCIRVISALCLSQLGDEILL